MQQWGIPAISSPISWSAYLYHYPLRESSCLGQSRDDIELYLVNSLGALGILGHPWLV